MKSLLIFSALVFPMLVHTSLFSQEVIDVDYTQAVREARLMIDSLMQSGKVPGIDVAVSIDGRIVWSEGFGYGDLEQKTPVVSGVTRFRIGSVSKPLTSAAIGLLMDQEKLDIDALIQTYVPAFPQKKYPVTIRQVGGHIAGIRHYRDDEFLSSAYYETVSEGLAIFKDDSLLFAPGTEYSYSSYGFNLLSAAIEGASGQDFLTYMQENVFEPLGMISTTADINRRIISNRTSFYALDEDENIINAPYVDNSYKWAGGGFISTTHDLLKFGEAHMGPGFLSQNTLRTLITTQQLKNGRLTHYGIGWATNAENPGRSYGHSGGSVGGITSFLVYPGYKMVVVLLSNSSDTRYGNVPDRIASLFITN